MVDDFCNKLKKSKKFVSNVEFNNVIKTKITGLSIKQ
jgi:hypothetical protein